MSDGSIHQGSNEEGVGQRISSSWDPDREPVEELAEEFAQRHRRGERPSIEQYASSYPQLAEEIRDLFPTIQAVEQLSRHNSQPSRSGCTDQPVPVECMGDFRVICEIGRGGMGIVYEAEQVTLGRRVAVKVLPRQTLRSQNEVQRFHREAQTAAKLHHTNIVPVFGVGEQDGNHYIVMQLIHGVGLDEVLSELKRIVRQQEEEPGVACTPKSSRSSQIKRNAEALLQAELRRTSAAGGAPEIDPRHSDRSSSCELDSPGTVSTIKVQMNRVETASVNAAAGKAHQTNGHSRSAVVISNVYWRNVARIGVQVASALHYAHVHGTLHRDVKPGNLLLDEEGVVWVADFGLAKAMEHDNVTWTGDIVGTLSYIAPERFHGDADARSDIYSLGLTLYELLTFERAYDGSDRAALIHHVTHDDLVSPRRRHPDIPRDLETIVLKSIAREPSDRYQSAEDLASDLQCFLDDRPIQARRVRPSERLVRWCRRNRTVATLAATTAALLVLVSVVATLGYIRESTQRRRAEVTSQLAVEALDNIYGQFAPSPFQLPSQSASDDENALLVTQTPLPLSKDVAALLENLLDFYDRLSKQTDNDEGVLLKSIMSNRRVGDILHRLGEAEKAKAAYNEAIKRSARIAGQLSDKDAGRVELARIYNGLGMVLGQEHNSDAEAYRAHKHALELLESEPNTPEAEYELARTLYLLHSGERKPGRRRRPEHTGGDRDESDSHIRRAISLLDNLAEEQPEVPEYRFLLARCYLATCSVHNPRRSVSGDVCRRRAIDILEALVRQFPDAPDYRYELGNAYATFEYRWKSPEGEGTPEALRQAESRLRKALETTGDLELHHPNIPQYVMLKVSLHHRLAMVLEDLQRLEEAEIHFREALSKQRLVIRLSSDAHHQVWQAQIQLGLAEVLRDLKKFVEARTLLQSLIRDLNELRQKRTEAEHSRRFAEWMERILLKSHATLDDVLGRMERQEHVADGTPSKGYAALADGLHHVVEKLADLLLEQMEKSEKGNEVLSQANETPSH